MRAGVNIKALLGDKGFMKAYRAWLGQDITQRMLLLARRLALPVSPGADVHLSVAALHESVGANGMLDFIGGLDDLAVVMAEKDVEADYQMRHFLGEWGYKDENAGPQPSGSQQAARKPSKKVTRVSERK